MDLFAETVYGMTAAPGFDEMNVLLIGDIKGLSSIIFSGAHAYFFSNVDRARQRWRPFERLQDYRPLLKGKFDVVVSRHDDHTYLDFCKPMGFYISQAADYDDIVGAMVNPASHSVVRAKYMRGSDSQGGVFFQGKLREMIKSIYLEADRKRERVYIPDIDRIRNVKIVDEVTITHKGVKCSPYTAALMKVYNDSLSVYNPLYTTYTGVIDAFHKFPSTAFIDFDARIASLKELGLKVKEEKTARVFSERIKKRYEFLTTPLMPLLPQQALAYVKEGVFTAKDSVENIGVKKGKKYHVRVGWQKRKDGKLKRGFMTVKVNGHVLFEDREEDVRDFIQAFGLPKIHSMEDAYPEVVDIWKKKAAKMFPELLDFQLTDVALAATKPTAYIAHDRGLGKTLMCAAWGKLRGYKRVLICARREYLDKWESEFKKFGFKYEWLLDWHAVSELKERIKAGYKTDETIFYFTSFEFLGLENDIRIDPWTCVEKDKSGYIEGIIKEIKSPKCPSCGKTVGQARKVCPLCDSTDYSGRFCNGCKQPTYTFSRGKALTVSKCSEIEREARHGRKNFHSGTYPAYKKLKKLFKGVVIDEAQDVKNKNTLRSTAARSLHAKGRLLATANLMRNYPNELFWPVSWLLGFNNPMFPYAYKGGFPFFERQFGTQLMSGKIEGKEIWDRIPEVSNLTILWKLMAPFMVRRLKTDIEGVPPKDIECVTVEMDDDHRKLYLDVRQSKLDELASELKKNNPDARVIGANLWSLRAASTIPVANRYFPQIGATYSGRWAKMDWLLAKVREIKAKGEKVLIYSTLVDMQEYIAAALQKAGIKCIHIKQSSRHRFDTIARFNRDASMTACVSSAELIGRCYDIESATYVIFTDMDFSPEPHEQGMDRANRIISTKPLKVYFLLNAGTIDIHMYELVMQKGEAIKNVLDRRAVYQPADILREAVQLRVAKRILSEKLEGLRKPAIRVDVPVSETVVEVEVEEKPWVPVVPIQNAEQLYLFGESPRSLGSLAVKKAA